MDKTFETKFVIDVKHKTVTEVRDSEDRLKTEDLTQ